MKEFIIDFTKNDYDEIMYTCKTFEFNPGITCLTGCNGSGKTTLMNAMYDKFKHDGIPALKYYALNKTDEIIGRGTLSGYMDAIIAGMNSNYASEGESIKFNFEFLVQDIGYFVFHQVESEGWIFFDSLDSGFSIDNVREVLDFFENTMLGDTLPDGIDLYVIIAANSFEMIRGQDCIDVRTAKHMKFDDYEKYASYIMKSREYKDKRK